MLRIFLAAFVVLLATDAVATHTVFDLRVERFEIDGGPFGPKDGTPDFTDEFDTGDFTPNWLLVNGTAAELDDQLSLRSPGVDITTFGLPVTFDRSEVSFRPAMPFPTGDFLISSDWEQTTLATDNFIVASIQFFNVGTSISESISVFYANNSAEVATGVGLTNSGEVLAVTHSTFNVATLTGISFVVEEESAIVGGVTGEITFRLDYDSGTESVTASASVDGGSTFTTFTAVDLDNTWTLAVPLLGTDPVEPDPLALCRTEVRKQMVSYYSSRHKADQSCANRINAERVLICDLDVKYGKLAGRKIKPSKLASACVDGGDDSIVAIGLCPSTDLPACVRGTVDTTSDTLLGVEYSTLTDAIGDRSLRTCQKTIASSLRTLTRKRLKAQERCLKLFDAERVSTCQDVDTGLSGDVQRTEARISKKCSDSQVAVLSSGFGGSCTGVATVGDLVDCQVTEHFDETGAFLK